MMNRGVLQNSPVQQMMAAGNNPNWWNINNLMRPPLISSPSSSSSTSNFLAPLPNHNNNGANHHNDDDNNVFHHQFNTMSMPTPAASSSWLDHHHGSWSQLLLGGVFMGDEGKKMEATNWEEQQILLQQQAAHHHLVDVKQENSVNSYNNNNNNNVCDQEFQLKAANCWSHHLPQLNIPVSSPQSCVTSYSTTSGNNSLLDFSSSISSDHDNNLHSRHPPPPPDLISECNSTSTGGGVAKKAKVQPSSTQSTNTTFKVRKEKLGDRITALHQLVSPFGKTDTASVLLEAIGYIRFLQSQIEALSLPYLNSGAGNKKQPQPQAIQREKCISPKDLGQLVNDNGLKRKGGPDHQDSSEEQKDLRSRGLCLVPLSCTLHVGSDNGADYWAPAALGGGFR